MGQKFAIYSCIIIFLHFGFSSKKQTDKLFTTISALRLKKHTHTKKKQQPSAFRLLINI